MTIIEIQSISADLGKRILDLGVPAITNPHISSGLGGTTKFWHNGLIEISEKIFEEQWPYKKNLLNPYYSLAYQSLAGINRIELDNKARMLSNKLIDIGFSENLFNHFLFYPAKRINAWKKLFL